MLNASCCGCCGRVEWVSVVVEPGTALRSTRRDLKEHVLRRARELAESGRFEGWQDIEFQLRFFDGIPKARTG